MRIQIDRQRCQATGLCEATAPEVFRLGDDGVELIEGVDPSGYATEVAAAVDGCPMEALRRLDASGPP
ncbi:ferredoxin [Plantactinospora sp. GCM10030261]|uniref:ferredoxin n=1 Tax=Plantactinospora sp. GCM10030261 TaxID=3273420 RepID=UPI003612A298